MELGSVAVVSYAVSIYIGSLQALVLQAGKSRQRMAAARHYARALLHIDHGGKLHYRFCNVCVTQCIIHPM